MSTGKQPSVSGQSISGKKRVWVEFQEDTAVAEVAATVNQSATTCAGRLLAIQKTRDDEALASAREERKAKSARVFEGDAGLGEGIIKVKEQIKKLTAQLEHVTAALASPLPTGEVALRGKIYPCEVVEVRRTAIKEELSRLQMAIQAISLKGPSMLALVRKLAAEGDVRGEIVPPRGPRPRGLLCEETADDVVVHHYVGSSLPKHLCMAADLGDPEDLDDEALDEMMGAGPRLLLPGPRPTFVRLALHANLEAALAAANDNDEIHLPAGRHSANGLSRLRESVSISGSGKEQTVLTNNPTDEFFVDAAAASITLRHLTLRSLNGTEGIVRVTRGAITLNDCVVDCGGFEGIRVLGGASLTMTGCVVSGAASAGVQIMPGARAALEHCVVANNGAGGPHWTSDQGGIQMHIQFSTESVDRQLLKPSPTLKASEPPPSGSAPGTQATGGGGSSSSGNSSGSGGTSMLHQPSPRGTSLLAGGSTPPKAPRPSILQGAMYPHPPPAATAAAAPTAAAPAASSAEGDSPNLMPPPPVPPDRGSSSGSGAGSSRDRPSADEPLIDEGDNPLKPAALLSLAGCKIVRNRGAPIVFCQPRALLALGSSAPGRVPDGACVWVGRGNSFDGSPSQRYGFMAIEEQSMKAPKLQLTPRMTPIVTPAKLPSLIPTLALSPQIKKVGKDF